MSRQVAVVLYVVAMAAVIIGVGPVSISVCGAFIILPALGKCL